MSMSLVSQINISTSNTHWGRVLKSSNGLSSIANADILLLQEVIDSRDDVLQHLAQEGFNLIHLASRFGLAIAVRSNSEVTLVLNSVREYRLEQMGVIERYLIQKGAKRSHQFTEHGLLAVKLRMANGKI